MVVFPFVPVIPTKFNFQMDVQIISAMKANALFIPVCNSFSKQENVTTYSLSSIAFEYNHARLKRNHE
jgi:hypothetical protein